MATTRIKAKDTSEREDGSDASHPPTEGLGEHKAERSMATPQPEEAASITKLLQVLAGLEVQRSQVEKEREEREKNIRESRDKREQEDRERWEGMFRTANANEKQRILDLAEDRKARKAREAPKLAPLAGVEHLDSFLRTFRVHMTQFEVNKDQWTAHLLPLLDPASLAFQARMPTDDKQDFEKVSQMLQDLHGLSQAHYRANWREAKKQPGETFPQYQQRLFLLHQTMIRDMKKIEELADLNIQDKLLTVCSRLG